LLVAFVGAAGLLACDRGEEVEPFQVTGLRVLGVRAEPPEVTPAHGEGEPVVFDALVVGSEGEVSYEWSLCPLAGPMALGYPCFSDELPEDIAGKLPEELARCLIGETGQEAIFAPVICSYATYELILGGAKEAGEVPLELDPEAGLEMFVRLVVTDESDLRVEAVKQFRVTSSETPNVNPAIAGVTIRAEGTEPEVAVPWTGDETLAISVNTAPVLMAAYDDAEAETFEEIVDGDIVESAEALLFSWYATSGRFQRARTAPDLMDNGYTPDGESASAEDLLWVVVRDGRGGLGWIERRFFVTGANSP
jgi:hypothetical protein